MKLTETEAWLQGLRVCVQGRWGSVLVCLRQKTRSDMMFTENDFEMEQMVLRVEKNVF